MINIGSTSTGGREVVSGSKLSSLEIEKNCTTFDSKNDSNLVKNWDFCEENVTNLSHPRTAILLYKLTNIPKVAAPKGALQCPDEEKATFSQKYPNFE